MRTKFKAKGILNSLKNIIDVINLVLKFKKKYLIINIFLVIVMGFLPFISLINTQTIMNTIQSGGSFKIIIISMAVFVLVEVISEIITSLNSYYSTVYSDYLAYELNLEVLNKTKQLNLKEFENPRIYDLMQRAEQEAGLRPFKILTSLLSLFSAFIKLFMSISILAIWHWWILLIVLVLPIISSIYFFKIGKEEFLVHYNRTKYERKTWYIAHLLTKDVFIKEVKSLGLSNFLISKFKEIRYKFLLENKLLAKRRGIFTFIFQILNILFTNFVVLLAIFESFLGKILIGNLMTYIRTTSMVEENMKLIINQFYSLHQDSLYASQLISFLKYKNDDEKKCENKIIIDEIKKIELVDVSYKYAGANFYALKDINLIIHKGDKVALVGQNGSGKTTLIKILMNLYTDYTGSIYINDINIKEINVEKLKEKMSVVFQDFNEYQFQIKDNIGFGNLNQIGNKELILKASKNADAHTFIEKLPHKYEQQVGQWFEDGMQLSGGQWQKLAISRAFMREADFFILDEPTAALDPISEFNLFKNFSDLTRDKIGIFITHRFINAKFTSKIIVLENGEVIENGTHESLMEQNGQYAMLYNLQLGKVVNT